jgi:shikimate dehydrogenase
VTEIPGRLVLVGSPVAHSLSPRFQNAALRAAGVPRTYELCDVPPERLTTTMCALVSERAAGNVTIPHKERVWALCARRTPLAERVGAVNTFWVEDGVLVGDNTDVAGVDALARHVLGEPPAGLRVLLLGAGGAAAAVVAAAAGWHGCRVGVHARTPARAGVLCERFPDVAVPEPDLVAAASRAQVVINATPVGLHDDAHPLDLALLPTGAVVLDLVVRPGTTAWVRAARAAGHPAEGGLPMLVEQGAAAFERWLGFAPDRGAMWRALA